MAPRSQSANSRVQYGPRMILSSLAWAAMLFSPVILAAPISENPAEVARAALDKRANWSFNCYSPGMACRGMGATSAGGSNTVHCSPISSRGCSQYSFNGGGVFRLTGYLNRQCTGEEIIRVNGGSVTCLQAPVNWSGYLISRI